MHRFNGTLEAPVIWLRQIFSKWLSQGMVAGLLPSGFSWSLEWVGCRFRTEPFAEQACSGQWASCIQRSNPEA